MRRWTANLAGMLIGAVIGSGASADQGEDGQLNLLYWQAPSLMNPYLSGGIKEMEAASLVLEPLARYDETGTMVPWLARQVPTLENGDVSKDMLSITWRLRPDLVWSDGSAFTSEDVKFTWQYCMAEGGGCSQIGKFDGITAVDTPDAQTVMIRFDAPKPFPYGPFVGATAPILQQAQFRDCLGPRAAECSKANFAPIGTGPFMVTEFHPNDVVRLTANPNYREAGKPAFSELLFKGGGDAVSSARAVLQTGEFDYGWNLQLDPEILARMASSGKGQVAVGFPNLVERIVFNLTDPDPARGPARSTIGVPHPILSDLSVRKALSLAIDRKVLVGFGYGLSGRTTCSLLPALQRQVGATDEACLPHDPVTARALLDAAGWIDNDGDGVREKNGVKLSLLFQTSTNAVRQDFQALIKQWWSDIGVETELRNISANVFFGADPGSPDTYQKFFADVQMYAGTYDGVDPEAYLTYWLCDQAPNPGNQWQGANVPRYCSDEYDRLVAKLQGTGGLDERARMALKLDQMLTRSHVILPLVDRGRVSAHAATLNGVKINPWDSEIWNIADWHRGK